MTRRMTSAHHENTIFLTSTVFEESISLLNSPVHQHLIPAQVKVAGSILTSLLQPFQMFLTEMIKTTNCFKPSQRPTKVEMSTNSTKAPARGTSNLMSVNPMLKTPLLSMKLFKQNGPVSRNDSYNQPVDITQERDRGRRKLLEMLYELLTKFRRFLTNYVVLKEANEKELKAFWLLVHLRPIQEQLVRYLHNLLVLFTSLKIVNGRISSNYLEQIEQEMVAKRLTEEFKTMSKQICGALEPLFPEDDLLTLKALKIVQEEYLLKVSSPSPCRYRVEEMKKELVPIREHFLQDHRFLCQNRRKLEDILLRVEYKLHRKFSSLKRLHIGKVCTVSDAFKTFRDDYDLRRSKHMGIRWSEKAFKFHSKTVEASKQDSHQSGSPGTGFSYHYVSVIPVTKNLLLISELNNLVRESKKTKDAACGVLLFPSAFALYESQVYLIYPEVHFCLSGILSATDTSMSIDATEENTEYSRWYQFNEHEVLVIITAVIRALLFLLKNGITLGETLDYLPEQVFLCQDKEGNPVVKLALPDTGFSSLSREELCGLGSVENHDFLHPRIFYKAPERITGSSMVMNRSSASMYSLAMFLYEMIHCSATLFDNFNFDFESTSQMFSYLSMPVLRHEKVRQFNKMVVEGERPKLVPADSFYVIDRKLRKSFCDIVTNCWHDDALYRSSVVDLNQRVTNLFHENLLTEKDTSRILMGVLMNVSKETNENAEYNEKYRKMNKARNDTSVNCQPRASTNARKTQVSGAADTKRSTSRISKKTFARKHPEATYLGKVRESRQPKLSTNASSSVPSSEGGGRRTNTKPRQIVASLEYAFDNVRGSLRTITQFKNFQGINLNIRSRLTKNDFDGLALDDIESLPGSDRDSLTEEELYLALMENRDRDLNNAKHTRRSFEEEELQQRILREEETRKVEQQLLKATMTPSRRTKKVFDSFFDDSKTGEQVISRSSFKRHGVRPTVESMTEDRVRSHIVNQTKIRAKGKEI